MTGTGHQGTAMYKPVAIRPTLKIIRARGMTGRYRSGAVGYWLSLKRRPGRCRLRTPLGHRPLSV